MDFYVYFTKRCCQLTKGSKWTFNYKGKIRQLQKRKKGGKKEKNNRKGKGVFWIWQGYCTHKLSTLVGCIRPAQTEPVNIPGWIKSSQGYHSIGKSRQWTTGTESKESIGVRSSVDCLCYRGQPYMCTRKTLTGLSRLLIK